MFRNYLTIAFRILWNNKVFSIINMLGLAIGMAAALILFHYVRFEKSYDTFHENAENIYRVNLAYETGDWSPKLGTNYPGCGPLLKEEIPDVLDYVRFFNQSINRNACILSYTSPTGKLIKHSEDQESVYWADASVFAMFSFPLQYADPTGKMVQLEDRSTQEDKTCLITAVFEDLPVNSHLQFDILISLATLKSFTVAHKKDLDTQWSWNRFSTYALLKDQANPNQIELKIYPLVEKYMQNQMELWQGAFGENVSYRMPFQALKNVHLSDMITSDFTQKSDAGKLYFLTITAIMILLIACINYINLSTANATQRTKEVGLRKVIGARRNQLFFQFLAESFIINVIAATIAITIIQMAGSQFNLLISKEIFNSSTFDGVFFAIVFLILAVCVLISGFYPALILAALHPITAIKNNFYRSMKRFSARNLLVVFQFSASIIMISGIYAISPQLSHLNDQELGFKKDQTISLVVPVQEEFLSKLEGFKYEVVNLTEVSSASNSDFVPGVKNYGNFFVKYDEKNSGEKAHQATKGCWYFSIDPYYLETFNIKLVAGRNFLKEDGVDRDAILLNEAAVKDIGFESAEKAVGSRVMHQQSKAVFNVIGVF